MFVFLVPLPLDHCCCLWETKGEEREKENRKIKTNLPLPPGKLSKSKHRKQTAGEKHDLWLPGQPNPPNPPKWWSCVLYRVVDEKTYKRDIPSGTTI